ncbi:MAG: hypothetical protein ISS65_03730 [Desulfobacterales bacterium]|uniref:Uncharacterized protein n=1 Tax=Candidatus Desulfatibia profunda TaxID=2841695 RepID=A0A8J6NUZ0_9BACT|nr:hypothetical protein [Candidatus Desulfatibia profunda]MBL7179304.1 hypothetical protein [Desulfobacterales bacterium]
MMEFSEHQKLGKKLKDAHKNILYAKALISSRYPKKSKQAVTAEQALKAIKDLKLIMDNVVGKEHPLVDDNKLSSCYFGEK